MTGIYTIHNGDTLANIANEHGITLAQLLAINEHIDDPDVIFSGQTVNVPNGSGDVSESGSVTDIAELPAWYEIAKNELGTQEIAGPDSHNPRIIAYHSATSLSAGEDEVPWCSSFVNWCMREAGVSRTNSAAARSWLKWGKKLSRPKEGCVVVFSRPGSSWSGHVGFFKRKEGSDILVLGGNQSNRVNYSSYSTSRLLGYRWPK